MSIGLVHLLTLEKRRMMLCCFLLLTSAGSAISAKRCAHKGEAVELLSDIGNDVKDVNLYNENGSMIASWKDNTNEVEYVDPNYSGRIHMDEKRNIWILGVELKDAGRYYIKFGIHELFDILLTVKEELTEEQLQECANNLPDFPKEDSVRRDAIRGKAVTLFSNSDIGNNDKEVILYVNESTLIATWTWKNGPIELVIVNADYIGRIDMDRSKNIWIFDADVSDTGKYWIKCSGTDKGIEVELNILEKKLTEEETKNWLDDHQGFIEKYLGNLTDEVGKEISKWLEDHPGFFKKLFDISDLALDFITVTIIIVVTVLLVDLLLKLVAEVCTMLECSWCRKYSLIKDQVQKCLHDHPDFEEKNYETLKEDQVHKWLNDHPGFMETYLGTILLLPREDDTDSEVMNISGGTDPHLLKFADPHLSKLPPADMNISGSEADFKSTPQGKKKIYIREIKL